MQATLRVNSEPVDLRVKLGPLGEAFFVASLDDADQDGEVKEYTAAPVPAHNAAELATGDTKTPTVGSPAASVIRVRATAH